MSYSEQKQSPEAEPAFIQGVKAERQRIIELLSCYAGEKRKSLQVLRSEGAKDCINLIKKL